MRRRRSLGRPFGWLWAAYAVSTYGTGFGFGAMSIIAIRVLHSGPGQVSLLASVGLAAGALLAIPLGPWAEFRRKRPVMAPISRRWCGRTTCSSPTRASSPPTWSALVAGPPLGGAAIGFFGATVSVTADAISYLLSALGIRMIGGEEPPPPQSDGPRAGFRDLPDGWRCIFAHPGLRGAFLNRLMVGSLILCTEPLLAVLMLDELHFAPWQYGLAFAAPCVGGLVGSRLSRRFVARFGQRRVMLAFGWLTVGWPIGLAFIPAGTAGLLLVVGLQLGLVTSFGVFNPVVATFRLEQTAPEWIARTLSAWSVSTSATTAAMTALWGVLAELVGLRPAIAAARIFALPAPLLLPRGRAARVGGAEAAVSTAAPVA